MVFSVIFIFNTKSFSEFSVSGIQKRQHMYVSRYSFATKSCPNKFMLKKEKIGGECA